MINNTSRANSLRYEVLRFSSRDTPQCQRQHQLIDADASPELVVYQHSKRN